MASAAVSKWLWTALKRLKPPSKRRPKHHRVASRTNCVVDLTTLVYPPSIFLKSKWKALQENRFAAQSATQGELKEKVLKTANTQIDELLASMEVATSRPLARPDATGDPSRCSSPPQCPPSVDNAGSGVDLSLRAEGGKVLFESAECAETDLCELYRDAQAVLAKFGDGGM